MDIMNSKKTLLSLINGGAILGAPSTHATVKFQFATSHATAVANTTDGGLTFVTDSNGYGAVYVNDSEGGKLVSSKIQDISTAVTGANGGKTVTVTYINAANGAIATSTFDVVDESALESYLSGSKTIELVAGTGGAADKFEVIVDNATILVDDSNGLKTGLNIAYIAETDSTGATIALRDNNNSVLSSIQVSDIVGDGVLKDSIYHQDTNILELRFGNGKIYNPSDPTTYTAVEVNLQKLIDINDVFIGADSSIYLDATLDASTVTLNTKMQDPSTASANATGLADAWKVKQYVDSKSTDLAVSASGDSYIDASVDANDNKHINVAAQTADLTVAKAGAADTTISGTAGKLVDAADAATKVGSFVNARIAEEIDKLGETKDSSATYVKVEVTTENGDVSVVTVTEQIGSITGTASSLTGAQGLVSGDDVAEAVTTFVDGRIDASIKALDASIVCDTDNHDISIYLEEVDGVVTTVDVEHTAATVTFTAKSGDTPASLTGTGSFVMGSDIAAIKNYVDAVAEAGFDGLDSTVTESDSENLVTVTTGLVDGKLLDASCSVELTRGEFTAAPGSITVASGKDGLVTASEVAEAVMTALEWTVLS